MFLPPRDPPNVQTQPVSAVHWFGDRCDICRWPELSCHCSGVKGVFLQLHIPPQVMSIPATALAQDRASVPRTWLLITAGIEGDVFRGSSFAPCVMTLAMVLSTIFELPPLAEVRF